MPIAGIRFSNKDTTPDAKMRFLSSEALSERSSSLIPKQFDEIEFKIECECQSRSRKSSDTSGWWLRNGVRQAGIVRTDGYRATFD